MTVHVDIECDRCDRGPYTCQVTAGGLDGPHESMYACDECAEVRAGDMRTRWDRVEIVGLPKRNRVMNRDSP